MGSWLKKYVQNAGTIPKADTLRRDYMPKVFSKHRMEIKEKIRDQPLAIIVDVSPDRISRNVVNTIAVCGSSGQKF